MKLQVKTEVLKEMVTRAVKGASCNKLIPLTSMMAIELKDNKLTIHTTDMSNHLYIEQNNVTGDDFYVTVQVEQFSKLIGRLTCENVILELKDNSLEIIGNGTYNIELPLDENGQLIKFPNPIGDVVADAKKTTIELSTIKAILNTAKASIATTLEVPCYTGYYMGDKILTTDTYKICSMGINVFEQPVLISPEMMELLDVMIAEHIDVVIDNETIKFITADCIVYGYKMEGLEEYAVDALNGLLSTEFDNVCKVSKAELLATLDRIALFVGTYDNKAIRLNFTTNGIDISSKQTSGIETVGYVESENFKPFTGLIDIEMFTAQIKAYTGDAVELHYGNEQFISLVNGNITQIIAMLEENEQ